MNKIVHMILLTLAVAAALPASAHRAWILPSTTTLSSESPWVTFDAAISNEIFTADYHAMGADGIVAHGPDGKQVALQNTQKGKLRTMFDLELTGKGTYKVAAANSGLMASWQEDGERKRWRGTRESFASEVPQDAENLQITEYARRIETFVTAGAPTHEVFNQGDSAGLQLRPDSHPNDLFTGETATFVLLIDGEPAANVEVEIVPGGTRHRDQQKAINVTTDKNGKFSVDWPSAGFYWLGADYEDDKSTFKSGEHTAKRRASYMATLEVLPL